MYIDRAEWHRPRVPQGLDPAAANTHIGMFFTWLLKRNLLSYEHIDTHLPFLDGVRFKYETGAQYIVSQCRGDLETGDVYERVEDFMLEYYRSNETLSNIGERTYIGDYTRVLGFGLPTMYHVEDTWENFDRIVTCIDIAWFLWRERQYSADNWMGWWAYNNGLPDGSLPDEELPDEELPEEELLSEELI
ncbi:hypothetical protein ISF_06806 [Cordyceps fumosorosea ARSEF 2679]|uniref:DUF7832 domain-containing protein n=1 Tax=Cordyceps fumosorosea (strain ARSEF 2679) TaxID=1081104 RepID=A0A167R4N6_CORFA|nr:hypothetical protein ISF_06806 [Cordyceps fumosorosea ARSEF 2679]OAA58267.1 hypothetical protein ISF_06806 [Cordyceps fumosorosea ARSEF 2679]